MCYKKLTRKNRFSTILMAISTVVLTAKSEPHRGVLRCCKEHSRHKRKAIPEKISEPVYTVIRWSQVLWEC